MHPLTSRSAVRLLGASVCAAALGLATACGSSGAAAPAAPAAQSSAPVTFQDGAGQPAQGGHAGHGGMAGMGSDELELYAVQTGTLGVVVTDGEGRVLYGSDGDQTAPPQSHCTDTCAQSWLPLTVPAGQEPQLLGVDAEVVGRLARQDGSSQVTLGGWPVYVNRNDDGQLKAAVQGPQSAGWFAMSPSGEKVTLPG